MSERPTAGGAFVAGRGAGLVGARCGELSAGGAFVGGRSDGTSGAAGIGEPRMITPDGALAARASGGVSVCGAGTCCPVGDTGARWPVGDTGAR